MADAGDVTGLHVVDDVCIPSYRGQDRPFKTYLFHGEKHQLSDIIWSSRWTSDLLARIVSSHQHRGEVMALRGPSLISAINNMLNRPWWGAGASSLDIQPKAVFLGLTPLTM